MTLPPLPTLSADRMTPAIRASIAGAVAVAVTAAGASVAQADPASGDSSGGTFAAPPSPGSRPALSAPLSTQNLPRPGNAPIATPDAPTGTIAANPVLQRIAQEQAQIEALSERLNEATTTLDTRIVEQSLATMRLASAAGGLLAARTDAAEWSREAYINASRRLEGLPTDPRLGMLGEPNLPDVDLPLREVDIAKIEYDAARIAADAATQRVTNQRTVITTLRAELTRRGTALAALKAQQAPAVAAAEQRRDAANAALASQYVGDAAGSAGAKAIAAVEFALRQLGKPYEWGAEGPNRYDCSGLVQTAYAMAGVTLPRTARQQYLYTKSVPVSALLPGDLLFFATNKSDWNTIHHVGIYLGNGKMVHAPTTGDVVKVAPVWWAEYFGATRVVPGKNGPASRVAIPGVTGSTPGNQKPAPKPSPTRPAAPTAPPKSPTAPVTPTTPVSPSVPATPTTPVTPTTPPKSPEPSDTGSASPTPKPDPTSPSAPNSPCASPTPSASLTPSASPTPTPSTSPSTPSCPS